MSNGMKGAGAHKRPRVLLVDDEPDLLDLLELDMVRMGLDSERAQTVAEARARLAEKTFDLCLTDMRLPDGEGLEVVRHIAEQAAETPVAVITAFGSAENAVVALKAGAFDYVEKPVTPEKIRSLVRSALKLPEAPSRTAGQRRLVGDSPPMQQVRALIDKVARSQAPVFISGATGTGKEVAARLIHGEGPRATAPFVAVNCGAIPENLMESEFFGYRKGAFTGADADRDGFFQAADGGTLFLDEVVDLPLPMQVKLLRAIQEKRVRRVGGVVEEPVDVRLISASHQDLGAAVASGRFRHDLFYRLNVISMHMPALRERREDVAALAEAILDRLAGARHPRLSPQALEALGRYDFPGNVRELENMLERALALYEGDEIRSEDLCITPGLEGEGFDTVQPGEPAGNLQDYLDSVERKVLVAALAKTGNNKTAAARLLGVTFRSLRYRLERLGID
jgi:two-component system, NtrC family, response regulator PilR